MQPQAKLHVHVSFSGWASKRTKVLKLKKKVFLKLNGVLLGAYAEKRSEKPKWEMNIRQATFSSDPKKHCLTITAAKELRGSSAVPASKSSNAKGDPAASGPVDIYFDTQADFSKWEELLREASQSAIEDYYDIQDLIGTGAYGEVRKALNYATGKYVACKVMQRTPDPKELELIRREVEVMRNIQHENVVTTYDVFDAKTKLYILMDYMPGGDLFEVISETKNFSEEDASQVMREILNGVKYLHDHNIVHRDIKPENILCESRTFPLKIKLTDFGFANFAQGNQSMTTQIGTPFYMAPEILTGKPFGPPVDLFACGVVCYALLSGTLPFKNEDGAHEKNVFERIVTGDVVFPAENWKNVSEEAKLFVKGLLEVNPTRRLTVNAALSHKWFDHGQQPKGRRYMRLESNLQLLKNLKRQSSTNFSLKSRDSGE